MSEQRWISLHRADELILSLYETFQLIYTFTSLITKYCDGGLEFDM